MLYINFCLCKKQKAKTNKQKQKTTDVMVGYLEMSDLFKALTRILLDFIENLPKTYTTYSFEILATVILL